MKCKFCGRNYKVFCKHCLNHSKNPFASILNDHFRIQNNQRKEDRLKQKEEKEWLERKKKEWEEEWNENDLSKN